MAHTFEQLAEALGAELRTAISGSGYDTPTVARAAGVPVATLTHALVRPASITLSLLAVVAHAIGAEASEIMRSAELRRVGGSL